MFSRVRKDSPAVEERRATFTPFVVSVDGVLGHDAKHLLKRLNCTEVRKVCSNGMGNSCQIGRRHFTSDNLCLCGSNVKWRSGHGMDADGASHHHCPH